MANMKKILLGLRKIILLQIFANNFKMDI